MKGKLFRILKIHSRSSAIIRKMVSILAKKDTRLLKHKGMESLNKFNFTISKLENVFSLKSTLEISQSF